MSYNQGQAWRKESCLPERNFRDLPPSERVVAILAAVREPISRRGTIIFGNVDYEKLEEKEKDEVDAVFQGEQVDKSGEEGQEIYWLKKRAKQDVEAAVDMASVHDRIAGVLEEKWAEMKRQSP